MGGKLLKNWGLPERRLDNANYEKIKSDLLHTLATDAKFNEPVQLHATVAPSIRNKADHGDLDIIVGVYGGVEMTWKGKDFLSYIEELTTYKPHVNSNVISFPIQGFQVDATFVPYEEFAMSVAYTSWGDMGNLMGRIYHKMGLHYGHAGLQFWIRQGMFDANIAWSDNDHIYEKAVLSRNAKEIFTIGGFDYDRWLQGFESEQDTFEFVTSSKYFDPSLFQLEALNHTNRTRNKKRGMYMRFIEFVNSKEWVIKEPFLEKSTYALYYQTVFPHLHTKISRYRLEYEIDKVVKQKLSGKQVIEWLGGLDAVSGPCVGKIMTRMKEIYTPTELLVLPIEKIKQDVVEYHKTLC